MSEANGRNEKPLPRVGLYLVLALGLCPSMAAAQDERPADLLSFPERARAVRPMGSASQRFTWDGALVRLPGPPTHSQPFVQLATPSASASVPYGSLAVTLNASAVVQWFPSLTDDQVVALTGSNPEVGALFVDAPIREVRYQLGGAVAVPVARREVVDGLESSYWSTVPLDSLLRLRSLGWNAHRLRLETLTIVARGQVEVDPHPALTLALEIDVPLSIGFDGRVSVVPQGALTIAARADGLHLIGLRAELVADSEFAIGANVTVELFARLVLDFGDMQGPLPFVRFALRAPLGPAYPILGTEPGGWAGGSLEFGALL